MSERASRSGDGVGGHVPGAPTGQSVGDLDDAVGRGLLGDVEYLLVVGGEGAVDDVDARGVAGAGDGDVALLEGGHVGGVVAGDVVGGALDAVGGAGIAVVEAPGGQVGAGDADGAFAVEVDDDLGALGVEVEDGAGGAVLDEVPRAGSVEGAVVAAGDDLVADHELASGDDERGAVEFAVCFEERSGAVVERAAGRVRAGDHRVVVAVESGGVPVGDDRVEGLTRGSGADDLAGVVVAGERVGDVAVAVVGDREPFGVVLLTVVVDEMHEVGAAVGAEAAEHAADVDRAVLVGIADELEGAAGAAGSGGEAGEVAGAEHRRFVDDDDRAREQTTVVGVVELEEEAGDGAGFAAAPAGEPGGAFELARGGGGDRAADDRDAGGDVRGDDGFGGVGLAGAGPSGDGLDELSRWCTRRAPSPVVRLRARVAARSPARSPLTGRPERWFATGTPSRGVRLRGGRGRGWCRCVGCATATPAPTVSARGPVRSTLRLPLRLP